MTSRETAAPDAAAQTAAPPRWVAVFDLDGTLTWRDTLLPFLMSFLRRHPWRLLRLWRLPFALGSFLVQNRDRGLLKSRVIRMVMGGATRTAIDACADSFVDTLKPRHRFRLAGLAENRESPRRRKTALPHLAAHAIPRFADSGLWQQCLRLGPHAARRSRAVGKRQCRRTRPGGAIGHTRLQLDLNPREPKQSPRSTGL